MSTRMASSIGAGNLEVDRDSEVRVGKYVYNMCSYREGWESTAPLILLALVEALRGILALGECFDIEFLMLYQHRDVRYLVG